ncbi:hypothetical protein [Methylobacterium sp. 88A]|nr:hypothetical protein [Methylobacterium sp. 88A]
MPSRSIGVRVLSHGIRRRRLRGGSTMSSSGRATDHLPLLVEPGIGPT